MWRDIAELEEEKRVFFTLVVLAATGITGQEDMSIEGPSFTGKAEEQGSAKMTPAELTSLS